MSAGQPTSSLLDDTITSNYSINGLVGSPAGVPYFGRRKESSRSLDSLSINPGAQLSGSAAAMYLTKCKHRGMQPIPAYYQRLLLFDTSNRKSLDFSDMHPFGVDVDAAALLADSFHIVLDILVVSPDVRRVDLSNAGVNDEWAEHVAHTTLKCPGITTIDLSRNPLLTDSAGAVLMAMLKTRAGIGLRLKHVSLHGSSMSPSMAKALASAGAACGSEVLVEGSTLPAVLGDKKAVDGGLNMFITADDSDAASTHGTATPTFLTVPKRGRSWSCSDLDALTSDGAVTPSKSELSPAAVALVYRGRHVVRCLFGLFHRSLCVLCWEPPIRTLMWFILLLSWLLTGLTVGTASVAVAVLLTHTTNVHQQHPGHHDPSDKQHPVVGTAPQENPLLSLVTGLYHVVFQHTFKAGNIDTLPTVSGTQSTMTATPSNNKVLALIPASNQLYRWKVLLEEQVLTPLNASDDPHRVLEALHEAFAILEMLIVGVSLSGSTIPSSSKDTHGEVVGGGGHVGVVRLSKKGSFANYLRRHRRTLMLAMLVCLFVVVPLESVLSLVVVGLFLWVPVWSPLISIIRHSSEGKASLLGHWLLSLDSKGSSHKEGTLVLSSDAKGGISSSPTTNTAATTHNGSIQSNLLPLSFMFLHQSAEDAVVRMLSMLGGDAPLLSMTILPTSTASDDTTTPYCQSKAVAKLNLARVVEVKGKRVVGSTVARGGLMVPLQYAATPLVVSTTTSTFPIRLDVTVFVSTSASRVLEGTVDFSMPLGNDPVRIEVPLYYLSQQKDPLPPTDLDSSITIAPPPTRTSDRFLQRRRSSTLVSSLVGEVEKQEKRDRDRYSFALNHEHRPTAVAAATNDAFSRQPPTNDSSQAKSEVVATLEVEIWRTGLIGMGSPKPPAHNKVDFGASPAHLPHLAVRAPSISVSSPGDETDPFSDSLNRTEPSIARQQTTARKDGGDEEEEPCFTSSGNGSVPPPQHNRRTAPAPLSAKALLKGGKDVDINTTPTSMRTPTATHSKASGRKGVASTGKRSTHVGRRLKL